jgi:REP element-mobilizing transposase RayT
MMKVSRDNPCLYLTSVARDRLPIFQTDAIKHILCAALDEARRSAGILIFAYVVMPDHTHLITDGARKASDVLRFTNGIAARRVIDYLKEKGFVSSLEKLKQETKSRQYQYSLWAHHPNAFLLTSEAMFMQKVNYIHQNPVRAGLVERSNDYFYSSARIWRRMPLEHEPLQVDAEQIDWRKA